MQGRIRRKADIMTAYIILLFSLRTLPPPSRPATPSPITIAVFGQCTLWLNLVACLSMSSLISLGLSGRRRRVWWAEEGSQRSDPLSNLCDRWAGHPPLAVASPVVSVLCHHLSRRPSPRLRVWPSLGPSHFSRVAVVCLSFHTPLFLCRQRNYGSV